MQLSATKKLVFCAICVALCVVLPMAFHALGSGTVFLPMHVPVLLSGLVYTWPYAEDCGQLRPLLSTELTGMPAAAVLPSMMAELAVYGLVTALVMRLVHTGRLYGDLYIALCCAIPMGAWAATLIAMKGYSLTGEKMKEIQAVNACRRDTVATGMKLQDAMEKWQPDDQLPAEYRA